MFKWWIKHYSFTDNIFSSISVSVMAQQGNREFKIGMVDYVHVQRSRAQKDSGGDVLLFFITLVYSVVAGLFLFSMWLKAILHYSCF